MQINSIPFVYFIIPLFFLYYLIRNYNWQNLILTIGTIVFLIYSDLKMSWCAMSITIIAYFIGLYIEKDTNIFRRKFLLFLGIIISIGTLVYFKYLNLFVNAFVHSDIISNIVIPLGISFYTFRTISYLIDVYRRDIHAEKNPVNIILYILFFPTFLSGPIDQAKTFLPYIKKERLFNYVTIVIGCRQILWGMFKKMVIADNLGFQVNEVWNNLGSQSSLNIILAAILYFFQLYMDFSGYSDMAIGVGKIFGINVTSNFKYPFFSRNISEFWRRWHMSLNNWFMRYLYIPLGGNRHGKVRTIVNTMIVFTLCGLWHGSSFNYALWGCFNGLLFVPLIVTGANRKYKSDIAGQNSWYPSLKEIKNIMLTFIACTIGFIIFRAPSLASAYTYIVNLVHNTNVSAPTIWDNYANICLFTLLVEWLCRKKEFPLFDLNYKYSKYVNPILYIGIIELILHYGKLIDSKFIYANF